jgi:hypothetical protein
VLAQSRIGRNLLASLVYLTFAMATAMASARAAAAQSAPANSKQDIVGTWQGTLNAGRRLRIVVIIARDPKSEYKVVLYSIDQNPKPMPAETVTFHDQKLTYLIPQINGSYEGKQSADGNRINGTWTQTVRSVETIGRLSTGQNQSLQLNLTRATPETQWTIP